MIKGKFKVVRDCCTSGNCITCISSPNHVVGKKIRIIHIDNISKDWADQVAKNFSSYNAVVEKQ